MTRQEKNFCQALLKFQKKGIKPMSTEIWKEAGMPRITFYTVRNSLIKAKIVSRHDRGNIIEYSLNEKKLQETLKNEKPTLRVLAKKHGVSAQTILNWRRKGKI